MTEEKRFSPAATSGRPNEAWTIWTNRHSLPVASNSPVLASIHPRETARGCGSNAKKHKRRKRRDRVPVALNVLVCLADDLVQGGLLRADLGLVQQSFTRAAMPHRRGQARTTPRASPGRLPMAIVPTTNATCSGEGCEMANPSGVRQGGSHDTPSSDLEFLP